MNYHARFAKLAASDADIREKIKALEQERNQIRKNIKALISDEPKTYTVEDAESNMTISVKLTRYERKTIKKDCLEKLAKERFGRDGEELVKDSTEMTEVVSLRIERL